ncbi:LuxS/MPP-like metallohydrolase [Periconia macrospinosa]|uniref:LuxS/MPP-like metallohydrolase n=1 Tax=Periconia macrospinosa TaxID=97972 RepID=A0A2V1E193_9PLEO|nr:LuxS/MPP-like metallohydrolase [Periconia macrospinosa]
MGDSGRPVARPRIEDLERPALDDRSYRIITLENKLEAILIHDPETDKASAALDVNVGSYSDWEDMPGIAHAVEHLLFMGTEKYPEENNYNKYLTSHSGMSNAYTAATSTNYYFELAALQSNNSGTSTPNPTAEQLPVDKSQSPLWGALDRFGQFFICPLFLEDTVDREIKAVDSENKKNLQNDTWRLHQLNKSLSNPKHPSNHFSTGSWKTLHDDPIERGVQIRDKFMEFHAQHYSANRMKLVVLGRENLDTLEEWVDEIFSKIPNKDLPRKRWDDVPVYTEKELLIQTFAKPVFESRTLEISFLYRDEEEFYESHPSRYLSHLIGHEGPGSILAYIKAKGWANGLGAGGQSLCPGSGVFQISVKLTEDGLSNYKEIVKIIFQYIAMIREHEPQQWIVNEQITMSEVDFRFKQKSPPNRTTSNLASVMQKPYDRKMILSAPAVIRKFDAQRISEAISYLRPDNFRFLLVSQEFPGDWDQKEKWYGTEYKTEKIPQEFLQEIKDSFESKTRPQDLHLPHKNEFIPSKLQVEKKEVAQPLKAPKLIRNDASMRLWWKKDDQFWVPKANVHIQLRTPLPYATARTNLMTSLYRDLVNDALVEYAYDADISGLNYEISSGKGGITLAIQGYNDKLPVLLEKVLVQLRDLEVREDRFKIIHDRTARSYRNWDYQQPYLQVGTYARYFRTDGLYLTEAMAEELDNVTAQDVQQFFSQVLKQFHIEIFVHGNLYKEEALKVADLVEKTLQPKRLPLSQYPIRRELILPAGGNFIYERPLKDPANVNHCIEYGLYLGNRRDDVVRAKQALLSQMTDEPAFNQLRTIEQLGYVVFSGATPGIIYAGYRIMIQSEKDCRYLEGRIDHFLTQFEETLANMSDEEFEKHKGAVITKKLEKFKNLNSEFEALHIPMIGDIYEFTLYETDAENVAKLTKQQMQDFYAHHISPSSPHRAKLSVHLKAQASPKQATLEDLKAKTLTILPTILKAEGVLPSTSSEQQDVETTTIEALTQTLSSATTPSTIPTLLPTFLSQTLHLSPTQTAKITDEATSALGLADTGVAAADVKLLPASSTASVDDVGKAVEEGDAKHPILVTDAQTWKAGLLVSRGLTPGRDLGRYVEDAAAKL